MQVQSGTVGFFQLPNMLFLADVHLGLQTTPPRKAQGFPLTRFAGQRASIVATSTGGHAVGIATALAFHASQILDGHAHNAVGQYKSEGFLRQHCLEGHLHS
jgi:hypothetical protein